MEQVEMSSLTGHIRTKLEDVLTFIRQTSPEMRELIMHECVRANRAFEVRISHQLNPGDRVGFPWTDGEHAGVIEKVNRSRGRVQVKGDDGVGYGLPASMVRTR